MAPLGDPPIRSPTMAKYTIGDVTLSSARRLHAAAAVVLFVVSMVAALGVAAGISVAILNEYEHARLVGSVIAAGSVFTWIVSMLPYLAAQTVARYVEFRVRTFDDDE